ncbi:response regulator [Paenibacillus arenilitoris]|uniref:Response regulator n=1 Tax=Paenibacillus arenilitoris TaxID=2772299 RepID=A0A927H4L2_9BACL|nr:response regulator [Paenibacillus arenilitoris]MBD2868010.1 response regulator [Paenibacillus arenilitoris]
MNILLVDDEAIDLEWLRRRVAGSDLALNVVGTAGSGFSALKLLETEQVDIILSDIRMPIMTGMEFARKAKELQPQVQIVFISGHEDFGYAKEALQINAAGYLLKPVDDRELYDMLRSLCEKVGKEREQHRSVAEALSLVNRELLLRWFNEPAQDQAKLQHIHDFLAPLLAFGTAAAIIEADDLEWKLPKEEERRACLSRISRFIEAFASERGAGTFIAGYDSRFVLLANVEEERFASLLEELIGAVRRSFPVTITVGIGMYAKELGRLHESYRQAQAALSAKWLLGKNRLINDGSKSSPKAAFAPRIEETVEKMLEAILDYDLVTIDDCLIELFNRSVAMSRKQDVYDLIVRVTSKLHADLLQQSENLYELLKWESHQPAVLYHFETMGDVLSWLRRRFFELSELLYAKKRKQSRKLVGEIVNYVDEKLEHRVTLKEVAARFAFTPNYLGHLFKEETGTLFSDFLNERRMNRVCELLADPTLKIYEIAERVGYKNIIYFNRQFKQSTGMTPGEYRKKHNI